MYRIVNTILFFELTEIVSSVLKCQHSSNSRLGFHDPSLLRTAAKRSDFALLHGSGSSECHNHRKDRRFTDQRLFTIDQSFLFRYPSIDLQSLRSISIGIRPMSMDCRFIHTAANEEWSDSTRIQVPDL